MNHDTCVEVGGQLEEYILPFQPWVSGIEFLLSGLAANVATC